MLRTLPHTHAIAPYTTVLMLQLHTGKRHNADHFEKASQQRRFLDSVAEKLKFHSHTDWYSVTHSTFHKHKGIVVERTTHTHTHARHAHAHTSEAHTPAQTLTWHKSILVSFGINYQQLYFLNATTTKHMPCFRACTQSIAGMPGCSPRCQTVGGTCSKTEERYIYVSMSRLMLAVCVYLVCHQPIATVLHS